ncbi:hypothetical protein MPTK1_3g22610 [Marchantia polymorpha subsp. ruderalis]|uniref:Uncharacterized protein n=2 Tax=Marchantia polymorpha TaxID=3197 RepID=A0AAF6B3N7_MARPO|nr:hypothetical protein MARPO_0024s0039 [Marchantia polymorpha]BBN06621.1 hypothetical protein Mp_3g22610 [Marchantia polymorpha subsp. ruderalis]|eukprot:PTQ43521.1 hypothetical protein MARPO_0024s0039 [Marchantia polymorpha]
MSYLKGIRTIVGEDGPQTAHSIPVQNHCVLTEFSFLPRMLTTWRRTACTMRGMLPVMCSTRGTLSVRNRLEYLKL